MALNFIEILISFLFLVIGIFWMFPLQRFLSEKLKIKRILGREILILLTTPIILVLTMCVKPFESLISTLLISFSFFIFLFGMLSNRKYIYGLALVCLALTPIMIIVGTDKVAEFLAQTCYLLLVLGVLKDIFYEKIFK